MKKLVMILATVTLAACTHHQKNMTPPTARQLLANDFSTLSVNGSRIGRQNSQGQTETWIVRSDFLFANNSTHLRPGAMPFIQDMAKALNSYDIVRMSINAYTDNNGDPKILRALSTMQANKVQSLLLLSGLHVPIVNSKGYGAQQPIADVTTELGQFLNRRIEIQFKYTPHQDAWQ